MRYYPPRRSGMALRYVRNVIPNQLFKINREAVPSLLTDGSRFLAGFYLVLSINFTSPEQFRRCDRLSTMMTILSEIDIPNRLQSDKIKREELKVNAIAH